MKLLALVSLFLALLAAPLRADQTASVDVGGSFTLSVTVQGTAPFTYQWQRNGANLTGQTSSTLVVNNVSTISAGNYTVVVTNAAGSATSDTAAITILVKPPTNPTVSIVTGGAPN